MTNTERFNPLPGIEAAVANKEKGALIHEDLTRVLKSHGITGFTIEEVKLVDEDKEPDPTTLRLCCDFRRWPPCWFCLESGPDVAQMGA